MSSKPWLSEFCLHPHLVEDVVEDLLSSDIISKDNVEKLKNDNFTNLDPNVIMDLRHLPEKKDVANFGTYLQISTANKLPDLKETIKTTVKIKDLKDIDKEIAKTKRNLDLFHKQLKKKNDSLVTNISNLEKVKVPNRGSSPVIVQLSEGEVKHYFDLHLDHLESAVLKSLPKGSSQTWKPYELKDPTIITVTTSIKDEYKQPSLCLNSNEVKETCKDKTISVSGKPMPSHQLTHKIEEINVVPNNSPTNKKISINELKISQYVVNLWKNYVRFKKLIKFSEHKAIKDKKELLKTVLQSWCSYVKMCKEEKIELNKSLEKTTNSLKQEIIPQNRLKEVDTKYVLPIQPNSLAPIFSAQAVSICKKRTENCSKQHFKRKNSETKLNFPNTSNNTKNLNNSSCSVITVNSKTVTPEEVGLVKPSPVTPSSCSIAKQTTKIIHSNHIQNQESFASRYETQQRIIAQQLAVIEKQKELILDLKAKALEKTSTANLKKAESQLAQATMSFNRKLQPVVKTIISECRSAHRKQHVNSTVIDKSEQLTKSLLQRQEYCKQLAEKTRLRKQRADEEQERLKMEEEERQKQEKDEQKRLKVLQMREKKQLAETNARNEYANKLKTKELTEKALHHYNKVLLKKALNAFQQNIMDVNITISQFNSLYEKKLLKRMLINWRREAQKTIQIKNDFANKHYSVKLMLLCWNVWHRLYQEHRIKIQVSEDMFALKLQERMFRRWQVFTAQQYLQTCCRLELAERLYRRQLLRRCFSWWRQLPRMMFVERQREQRRRAWRETVQQLIPDFNPVFTTEQLDV